MAIHRNRKGLDLPITGEPEPTIDTPRSPRQVAILGADYPGMKPTMHVQAGDDVRRGQLVFEDKKTPGVRFTAPGDGKVVAVNRGERRAFQSLVIALSSAEMGGAGSEAGYSAYTGRAPGALTGEQVRDLLLESGEWVGLRRRPFGRIADPEQPPGSIFVTVADSEPLAPDPQLILRDKPEEFRAGVEALSRLTEGPVFVCAGPDGDVPLPDGDRFQLERFAGPHPSGTAGYHIHVLDPVNRDKVVWHVGLQDTIAIGHLFRTGSLHVGRIVSLAGPGVRRPRLLRTRVGTGLDELVSGELHDGPMRTISGSVLSGRAAMGEVHGYLGRYDNQISVIEEDESREFFGWLKPGLKEYSVTSTFLSKLIPGTRFALSSSTHGSERAIIPIGVYEKVFPFDILPTQLLRSVSVGDVEFAEELGALELVEEDLALCTFVCPGKNDYGPMLRDVLTTIEKEG